MTDMIEKTIELKAPVSRVWRAITNHKEFGEWFRVGIEAPFVAGERARGNILNAGYEHLTMEVTVKDIEPERLFSFTWHPYAIDPNVDYSKETPTLVEFRLEPIPSGTRLVIRESGFDHIPSHRRADALRMNDSGWAQQLLNVERHVTKNP